MNKTQLTSIVHAAQLLWRQRYWLMGFSVIATAFILFFSHQLPIKSIGTTSLLIKTNHQVNPFLSRQLSPKALEENSAAMNALLHNHTTITKIAQNAGLLKAGMDARTREDIIAGLGKALSAKMLSNDTVQITYKTNRFNQVMPKVKTAGAVFAINLQRVINQFGMNLEVKNGLVKQLQDDIAKATTQMAKLKARYTANHSEVLTAEKELKQLHNKQNKLIHYQTDASEQVSTGSFRVVQLANTQSTSYRFTMALIALITLLLSFILGSTLILLTEKIRCKMYLKSVLSETIDSNAIFRLPSIKTLSHG